MPRKLPDLSTTQLIASAMATGVAALGASYLGVYGTIIGAALMSVISTAGSAVGKHYLDQGKDQLKELSQVQSAVRRRDVAEHAAEAATSADPTRTIAWHRDPTRIDPSFRDGDPNVTRLDPSFGGGDPNATRLDPMFGGGDPNATRRDPVDAVAGSLADAAGEDAVRGVVRRTALQSTVEWAKAHWVKLVVSSAAVFAIVIAGITLVEATTGQPIGKSGKGLTVTNVLGGGGGGDKRDDTPSPSPSDGSSEPSVTPSGTPTGGTPSTQPTTPDGQPTTGPTGTPTQEPTSRPTTSTPTTPSTPAPTENPPDGGQQGGTEQQRSAPAN